MEILNLHNDSGTSLLDSLHSSLADGQRTTSDDFEFQTTRSISTMSLYSDEGLAIYAEITELKAYYPFAAELEILTKYGGEIASRMLGLSSNGESPKQDRKEEPIQDEPAFAPEARVKEKWGDFKSGTNNQGVNGGLNKEGAIAKDGLVVELGSGSLQKTKQLLRSLSKLIGPDTGFESIAYNALDLERKSLISSLNDLVEQEPNYVTFDAPKPNEKRVRVAGLCATYDEGLAYLATNESNSSSSIHSTLDSASNGNSDSSTMSRSSSSTSPSTVESTASVKSVIWLGSSIGNCSREESASFLKNIAENVLNVGDTMLIGIDSCSDGPKIVEAYNDNEKVTERFILEGIEVCRKALGGGDAQGMKKKSFDYVNRWNEKEGRHEAYVRAKDEIVILMPASYDKPAYEIKLFKGELIKIEVSYKYTYAEACAVFDAAGLRLIQKWTDPNQVHDLYLLEKAPFHFVSTTTQTDNPFGLPSIDEWETLWKAWDTVILEMIPKRLLLEKPIDLRNPPLFYAGHLPTFSDIHLSRHFDEPLTEPAWFADIFERGIDPDVNDPTQIHHSHSKIPEKNSDWPSIGTIISYSQSVRERIRSSYERPMTRRLSRVLAMLIEHDAFHLETSLYIALQASQDLERPIGWSVPDWTTLARGWDEAIASDSDKRKLVLEFPSQKISIGQDDDDRDSEEYDSAHSLGWDCENPQRLVEVDAFTIDALPIVNTDYLVFLQQFSTPRLDLFPSSWTTTSNSLKIQDIKVRTLYGDVPFSVGQHWATCASAVQLQAFATFHNARLPTEAEIRIYLADNPVDTPASNIGFKNFHQLPPTLPQVQRDGKIGNASNGGVWEWTSTFLTAHEGYSPSILYPGYSSDFHDDAHLIIVGGSYLTQPRIAGRPSLVNWYQGGYPFVVAGARLVRS